MASRRSAFAAVCRSAVLSRVAIGIGMCTMCPWWMRAQSRPEPYLYVVKSVGEWVVSSDVPNRALRPLSHLTSGQRVALRYPERVDTSNVLLLRDPMSLRVARIQCKPVLVCRVPQRVEGLTFSSPAMPVAKATSALFARLGEGSEGRANVRQVGARGVEQDWGVLVLASDAGAVGLDEITARLGGDRTGLSLRVCSLLPAVAMHSAICDNSGEPLATCRLDTTSRCISGVTRATPVSIEIVAHRTGSNSPTIAFAVGVLVPRPSRSAVDRALTRFTRDLQAIRAQLSEDEHRGLLRAAVLAVTPSDARE